MQCYAFAFSCIFLCSSIFWGGAGDLWISAGLLSNPSLMWPQHPALFWITPGTAGLHLSSCWQDTQSNIYTPSGLTSVVLYILHLRGMWCSQRLVFHQDLKQLKTNQELSTKTCSFLVPFLHKQGGAAFPAWLLLNSQSILVLHKTLQQVIGFLH